MLPITFHFNSAQTGLLWYATKMVVYAYIKKDYAWFMDIEVTETKSKTHTKYLIF